MSSCEFCELSKNTFLHRTPLVAAFEYTSIALNLAYNKGKLYKTLDYWSRDMLGLNFSKKRLGLFSPQQFEFDFSIKIFLMLFLSTNQISLHDCFTSQYIGQYGYYNCFTNQAVTSLILKLKFSFQSSRFATWPKNQDKNLNILRTKRGFEVK